MKKWEKPVGVVENFQANSYISSCSNNTQKKYTIHCNVGSGDNSIEGITFGRNDHQTITYHAAHDIQTDTLPDMIQGASNKQPYPYLTHGTHLVNGYFWQYDAGRYGAYHAATSIDVDTIVTQNFS